MTSDAFKSTEDVIHGRQITLASGAKVWGGRHKQSIAWKYTSTEGAITHLMLSSDAVAAMVQLYQGMIGCDEDFASVAFEPKHDDVGADGG